MVYNATGVGALILELPNDPKVSTRHFADTSHPQSQDSNISPSSSQEVNKNKQMDLRRSQLGAISRCQSVAYRRVE